MQHLLGAEKSLRLAIEGQDTAITRGARAGAQAGL